MNKSFTTTNSEMLTVSHKQKRHANVMVVFLTSLPRYLTHDDYAYTHCIMALLNIFIITLLCITNHVLLFIRLIYYTF